MSEDEKRHNAVLDRNRNVLCFTTAENVVRWLKSFVEKLANRAYAMDGYDTGELESAGLRAVKSVMEDATGSLPHYWDCPRYSSGYKDCNCGVGNGG